MEAAPPEPPTKDLTAAVLAGGCRVTLALAERRVSWSGTLAGVLVLEEGVHPQTRLSCRVSLTVPTAGGGDMVTPSDSQAWELPVVEAGQRLELPFALKAAWGSPCFGEIGTVTALIHSRSGWWRTTDPEEVSLSVEITPPAEFVRAAAELAGLADLQLGLWKVISGGDGAANTLTGGSPERPVARVDLKLFRGPTRDYGELVVHPGGEPAVAGASPFTWTGTIPARCGRPSAPVSNRCSPPSGPSRFPPTVRSRRGKSSPCPPKPVR